MDNNPIVKVDGSSVVGALVTAVGWIAFGLCAGIGWQIAVKLWGAAF